MMKPLRVGITAVALSAITGYAAPTDPLPPNTVPLSQMMRELSANPGFTEAFLAQIQGGKKTGATLLTPDLVDRLRTLIVGKDWQGLDRFPGWTMAEITPTVRAISRIAADKNGSQAKQQLAKYLDIGAYSFDSGSTIDNFASPSRLPGFAADDVQTPVGYGIIRPDGAGPLAPEHADSLRLAYVLNRLAANGLDGVAQAKVEWDADRTPSTPEELIEAIQQTGHTVTVTDSRAFANFGQLHYNGRDVMMPFFLNTQIRVPGTDRPLLIPASHVQYEWHVHGPMLNADVAFFFAIDGKAEWRVMDEKHQEWEMKRETGEYLGADAIEVTRLASAIVRAYLRLHQAHPEAPFGGYFAFGVCQDVAAAIELKLTGKTTLFPNTADDRLFTDPRDAEVNDLIRRLPKDREGKPPQVERIFGSLPVPASDLATVAIPGLAADLISVHDAWTNGTLQRTNSVWNQPLRYLGFVLVAGAVVAFAIWLWRGRRVSTL